MKLLESNKAELIARLGVTQRRVDQMIEAGILIAGYDEKFDVDLNVRRYRAFRDKDNEYVTRELRRAGDALIEGMQKLRAEADVIKRRQIAEKERIGANIGDIDGLFRLGNSMSPEGHRPLLEMTTGPAVSDMINEYFALLQITIADPGAPGKRGATGRTPVPASE